MDDKTRETLVALAQERCPTCDGAKVARQIHYQEIHPTADLIAVDALESCPDCPDAEGRATGFRHPALRWECPGIWWTRENIHDYDTTIHLCDHTNETENICHGVGFLLPPDAELVGVLMELLLALPKPYIVLKDADHYEVHELTYETEFVADGPTLVAALAAALQAQEAPCPK